MQCLASLRPPLFPQPSRSTAPPLPVLLPRSCRGRSRPPRHPDTHSSPRKGRAGKEGWKAERQATRAESPSEIVEARKEGSEVVSERSTLASRTLVPPHSVEAAAKPGEKERRQSEAK